jgi:phosphoglycolate phosphatase-like HAD superfamily hydrolase
MLGDTPYDIKAAQSAGVATVALRSGGWKDEELVGATAIYDDPANLLENFATSPFTESTQPVATRANE